jgi:hypothetical protein
MEIVWESSRFRSYVFIIIFIHFNSEKFKIDAIKVIKSLTVNEESWIKIHNSK